MDRPGIRAFNPECGMCGQPRRKVPTKAPVIDFKFVQYRLCDWCDGANPWRKRRG